MSKYLISFPSAAMVVPDGELETVGRDARAVIDEAMAAGVYVYAGGIDEAFPPVRVSADGTVVMGGYPWAPTLNAEGRAEMAGPVRPDSGVSAQKTESNRPFPSVEWSVTAINSIELSGRSSA